MILFLRSLPIRRAIQKRTMVRLGFKRVARAGVGSSRSFTVDQASEAEVADDMLATLGLLTARPGAVLAPRLAARNADEAAAATILDAFHSTEPAPAGSSAASARSEDEAAVAAILGMLPSSNRKVN